MPWPGNDFTSWRGFPSDSKEALQLAREIYADPESRFPSVKSLLYALQNEFPDEQALPSEGNLRLQRGSDSLPLQLLPTS